MPDLQDLYNVCKNKDELQFVVEVCDVKDMKPYETDKVAYLRETLKTMGLHDFADYPDSVALLHFLKRQFAIGQTLDTTVEGATLQFKYLSLKAPSQEVLHRIEKTVSRALEILQVVVKLFDGLSTKEPDEPLRTILAHHFKFTTFNELELVSGLAKLRLNYRAIYTGLSTRVRISDAMGRHRQEAGYVSGKVVKDSTAFDPKAVSKYHTIHKTEKGIVVMGSIHLTFEKFLKEKTFLNHTPLKKTGLAGLVIHEASHKFCNTKDHAYTHEPAKYATLTHAQALDNADSYGFAALSIFCGKLVKDDSLFALTGKPY